MQHLTNNISEKDRAKHVEQFDDILRTFINEVDKFESKLGAIRDEEKDARGQEVNARELAELQVPRNDNVIQ